MIAVRHVVLTAFVGTAASTSGSILVAVIVAVGRVADAIFRVTSGGITFACSVAVAVRTLPTDATNRVATPRQASVVAREGFTPSRHKDVSAIFLVGHKDVLCPDSKCRKHDSDSGNQKGLQFHDVCFSEFVNRHETVRLKSR